MDYGRIFLSPPTKKLEEEAKPKTNFGKFRAYMPPPSLTPFKLQQAIAILKLCHGFSQAIAKPPTEHS
jgi:hypothetical protein